MFKYFQGSFFYRYNMSNKDNKHSTQEIGLTLDEKMKHTVELAHDATPTWTSDLGTP
jgi:hypothetical protein